MTESEKQVVLIPITDATRNDKTWPPEDPVRRLVFGVYLDDECVCGKTFTWEDLLTTRWWPHEKGRIVHAACWKPEWDKIVEARKHTNPRDKP